MRVRRIQKKQDASTISHHKRSLLNYKIGLSENRLPVGPCLQGLSCLSSPSPAQGCRCRSTISRKRRRSRQRAGPWSMWKELNTQVLFGNVFLWTDGHNFQTFTEEELPPQVCSRKCIDNTSSSFKLTWKWWNEDSGMVEPLLLVQSIKTGSVDVSRIVVGFDHPHCC